MWTVLKRLWNLAAFRVQRPTFSNMVVRGEKKLVTWRGRQAGWNKRKIRREDERSVIVSDAVFIVAQRERKRSFKDSSNRSLSSPSKGRTVTIVRRFLSPPRLVSPLVIPFCYVPPSLVLVIDHEHQLRGKNSNTSLQQYLAESMHASEIQGSNLPRSCVCSVWIVWKNSSS